MMHDVLTELLTARREQRPAVYTALIETRGSTPQKPGAAMLVFEDGSQTGTLGGGCVEAEVKRTALEQLGSGGPRIVSFQLNHDYGWDDGLICGGRMTMLIDPATDERSSDFYAAYHDMITSGQGCTEAVLLPRKRDEDANESDDGPVLRFLFDAGGRLAAGDAEAECVEKVSANLRPLAERPRPYVAEGVAYLPHLPRCRLVIVGAGHVGQQVARYASDVDFDVWVIDDRESYCNAERFPTAARHLVGSFEEVLTELPVDENTFCIIVTRGHNHDEEALFHLIRTSPRYLGMIGSKRKIRMIFDDLIEQGIPPERLEQVHAPLGFDIGSQTVPEIAVSIVAELVACRNLPGK
jgi:xanthine dehydrogenase accessory factor